MVSDRELGLYGEYKRRSQSVKNPSKNVVRRVRDIFFAAGRALSLPLASFYFDFRASSRDRNESGVGSGCIANHA